MLNKSEGRTEGIERFGSMGICVSYINILTVMVVEVWDK